MFQKELWNVDFCCCSLICILLHGLGGREWLFFVDEKVGAKLSFYDPKWLGDRMGGDTEFGLDQSRNIS